MTELMQCNCEHEAIRVYETHDIPLVPWQVCCTHDGYGRRGPAARTKAEAIAAWNADRLAEEKAREAVKVLTSAKDVAHNGWKRALEPMIDEALRLLEGR